MTLHDEVWEKEFAGLSGPVGHDGFERNEAVDRLKDNFRLVFERSIDAAFLLGGGCLCGLERSGTCVAAVSREGTTDRFTSVEHITRETTNNIRKKLGLSNHKVNLAAYLSSL